MAPAIATQMPVHRTRTGLAITPITAADVEWIETPAGQHSQADIPQAAACRATWAITDRHDCRWCAWSPLCASTLLGRAVSALETPGKRCQQRTSSSMPVAVAVPQYRSCSQAYHGRSAMSIRPTATTEIRPDAATMARNTVARHGASVQVLVDWGAGDTIVNRTRLGSHSHL